MVRYKIKSMKKYIFLFCLLGVSLPAICQLVIKDANAVARNVGPFTAIKASGGIDIILSEGTSGKLAVSAADPEVREAIVTEVKDRVLHIYYDSDKGRLKFNRKLRAYIAVDDLSSIQASGACDFTISGDLDAKSLQLKLSGASSLVGKLNVTNLNAELSGASTLKIDGHIINFKVSASGASDVKAYGTQATHVMATASGASDIRVTAGASIEAQASGASTIFYLGNPSKVSDKASGASEIGIGRKS